MFTLFISVIFVYITFNKCDMINKLKMKNGKGELCEEVLEVVIGRSNVLFRKGMFDAEPELFKYNSVKELVDYVNKGNTDIEKVKALIIKANRELKKLRDKKLYVRKATSRDKDAENRICITSR
jgi:hypothetical protein